ncbi:MAG: hypothetical protein ACTHMS_18680 [Jatrophihabitans sp.]|uniref:hypothetical protein n=1 Tax=Jatrophihabitans sp. TaxID=1932789 RepID=UPI003F7F5FA4
MTLTAEQQRRVRRSALLLVLAGAVVQLVLSAYYLGVGHSPAPHALPVGYVATDQTAPRLEALVDRGGSFHARRYADDASMSAAIRVRAIYGGVDVVDVEHPHLFVASAAGPTASTAIRTAFTTVVQQQVGQRVQQLVAAGRPIPPATLAALTASPTVTDVVPLPTSDRSGSSLGFLVQALALGATVASLGLGRIGALTRPSLRRGIGHVGVLVTYGVVSAAAVLWAASWFGVIPGGAAGRLYLDFVLLSLAVTASTAAAVALVGPAGALLGTLYFTLGVVVSGSSILPEFLPTWGRIVGRVLPTGAGVTAIRDSLYFPDASNTLPLVVLALYGGVGIVVVLVTNALANRTTADSIAAEREAEPTPSA